MEKSDSCVVVADAGPLIHLDEIAAMDLLRGYSTIWIPESVASEVNTHRPIALTYPLPFEYHRLEQMNPKVASISDLYTLHRGEIDALSLCVEKSVLTLLSDDAAARLAAKSLDITTRGTLGILIRSVRKGYRTPEQAVVLLEQISTRSSLHIQSSLIASILQQVKKEWF